MFTIHLEDSGAEFTCPPDERVLIAMERALPMLFAPKEKKIPVGCRQGGCGICRVQVVEGTYEATAMSRCHVSEEDERAGLVLACRLVPKSDLRLRFARRPKRSEQVQAKAEEKQ